MIKLLKLATVTFAIFMYQSSAQAIDQLNVTSVSDAKFSFNYEREYLQIDVTNITPPPPDTPTLWERIWGKKTKFGLVYLESSTGENSFKFPLFTYSAAADDKYNISQVAVFGNKIKYPILTRFPYSPNSPPDLKIVVHYWEDPKHAEVIKGVIGSATQLVGIPQAGAEKALSVTTAVVDLIEDLWPSKNQKNHTKIVLTPDNLKHDNITFGYIPSDSHPAQPIITIGFSKNAGYFDTPPLSSSLNAFSDNRLDVWKTSILEVDNNISTTGISPLFNQLRTYSSFISQLPLVYSDKVLLLARSIDEWANISVKGVEKDGNKIAFTMAQYRKLDNNDWRLLASISDQPLAGMSGADNCEEDPCREMATFISSSSMGLDISRYLPQTVSVMVPGKNDDKSSSSSKLVTKRLSASQFITDVRFLTDLTWTNFTKLNGHFSKWRAHFAAGQTALQIGDTTYEQNDIEVIMIKLDDRFYLQSISIAPKDT